MEDFTVEGVALDPENKVFKYALECVQYTNRLIYLTGKAGTGKTTFLKYLRKVTSKKMVVLAPTGIAAINAQGQTIHSFFKIPISLFVPKENRLNKDEDFDKTFRYNADRREMIRNLELLVIDEVSMVRCDLLDVIDIILRTVRKNSNPFGGVQVLLIGDTFQLPPVTKKEDWSILSQFYESEFFFSARVMTRIQPLYIELKKVYRQKEKEFIDMLNRIRVGKQESADIQFLNSRVLENQAPEEFENYIFLTTTNLAAEAENKKRLDALSTESFFFKAEIEGDFPSSSYPTNLELELKIGTQVMFIKNDWQEGYFNGQIGKVADFNEDSIIVEITDKYDEVIRIHVMPFTWKNIVYTWNNNEKKIEENVTGTFKQYPLRLAWAITIHKSQGQTFERIIADVGYSFAPGQLYVALSRCTSMNGLVLQSKISPDSIKIDPRVIKFAESEVPETLILEELQRGKADYYYEESRKGLKLGNAEDSYENLLRAIKYRNDIETSLFKRFFCTWIKKYHHKVERCRKLCEEENSLKDQLQDLQLEKTSLIDDFEVKQNKISELTQKIDFFSETSNRQKEIIQDLNDRISDLELRLVAEEEKFNVKERDLRSTRGKNAQLHKQIKDLQKQVGESQNKIVELNSDKETLERGNKILSTEKANITEELNRERNVKWYQKLFAKRKT